VTRVLIADDHRFFRSGVAAALESCGVEIAGSVADGEEALRAIESEDPDIVLLDIRMPVLDGVAMLEALRSTNDMRPVIVLAAELRDTELVRLMKAGVNSIVFKHEPDDQLMEAIKAVQNGDRRISGALMDKAFRLAAAREGATPLDDLTNKERKIANAVAEGRRNREIGEEMGLSEGSVKIYVHKIFLKLGITNRTELALLIRNLSSN
jgi:two-component system, NarL family, nitrate/nitrite response regulator NarL